VTSQPPILGQTTIEVRDWVGREEPVDHHRQHRHVRRPHRIGERDIDGRVLLRREPPVEHRLRQSTDEVTTSGSHHHGPLDVVEPSGPVALIERVEPVRHAVPQEDGLAANSLGDGRVLVLRVTGDVDATAERDRPRVQALRKRRLARANDSGEYEVGRGD